jgi:hypothetical protein
MFPSQNKHNKNVETKGKSESALLVSIFLVKIKEREEGRFDNSWFFVEYGESAK